MATCIEVGLLSKSETYTEFAKMFKGTLKRYGLLEPLESEDSVHAIMHTKMTAPVIQVYLNNIQTHIMEHYNNVLLTENQFVLLFVWIQAYIARYFRVNPAADHTLFTESHFGHTVEGPIAVHTESMNILNVHLLEETVDKLIVSIIASRHRKFCWRQICFHYSASLQPTLTFSVISYT
jgi:hypothetical protein